MIQLKKFKQQNTFYYKSFCINKKEQGTVKHV